MWVSSWVQSDEHQGCQVGRVVRLSTKQRRSTCPGEDSLSESISHWSGGKHLPQADTKMPVVQLITQNPSEVTSPNPASQAMLLQLPLLCRVERRWKPAL